MKLKRFMIVIGLFVIMMPNITNAQQNEEVLIGANLPRWSSDGSQIIFHSFRDYDIWNLDLAHNSLVNLTGDLESVDIFPSWALDGETIFFLSNKEGKVDLWEKNINTSELINLTSKIKGKVIDYELSPNGKLILFTVQMISANPFSVWVLNRDNLVSQRVSPEDRGFNYGNPTWANDSETIILQKQAIVEPTVVPYLINIVSHDSQELDHVPNSLLAGAHNGTRMAVLTFQDCVLGANIGILDSPSASITMVTDDCPASRIPLLWSPDDKFILFSSLALENDSINADIHLINVNTQQVQNLTYQNKGYDGNAAWSPDGQFIVYISEQENPLGDIWIMDNNGENKKNLTVLNK